MKVAMNIAELSGLTFQGNLRAMMNLKVQAYDYIENAQFIKEAYVPMVWLNESYTIPDKDADLYKSYVNLATYTTLTIMCVTIFGGLGILLGVAISLYRNRKLSEEQLPFYSNKNKGDENQNKLIKSGKEVIDIYEKSAQRDDRRA